MEYSRTHPYVCCLQPRPPGLNPIPVRLLYAVSRFSVKVQPLQHLCRSEVLGRLVKQDYVDLLPVSPRLKEFLREAQFHYV